MESVETNKNLPIEYRSEQGRLNILGFWIFLGAEIALFATSFCDLLCYEKGWLECGSSASRNVRTLASANNDIFTFNK